jgi:hypothetical protein
MQDMQGAQSALEYIDRIGTIGLAFIVMSLMRGWLITKREHDRELARSGKLEERLDRALHINERLITAGERIATKE